MKVECYRFYETYMRAQMGDSAHDTGHIYRVLGSALMLAQNQQSVNMDVLIAAALLHDVGREEQIRTGANHALAGARMAHKVMQEKGETDAFIHHVCECIRTHRFRSDDPPISIEAKLLYDADKLDVCGALGTARTLMYQGRLGCPIYSMSADGAIMGGEEKSSSFYSEYRRKLQFIHNRFLTEEGKNWAVQRSQAAEEFNGALCAEAAAGESGSAWRMMPKKADARARRIFNIALMLAGDSEKINRAALAECIMRGRGEGLTGIAGRVILDAAMLDDLGALGVARKLMEIGRKRQPMESLFLETWNAPEFHSPQARSIAQNRQASAQRFLSALKNELKEGVEEGKKLLTLYLE